MGGIQDAMGSMGNQLQQAATQAATKAVAGEVQKQMTNAISQGLGSAFGGGRRK